MALDKVFKQKQGIDIPEGPTLGLLQSIIHIGVQRGEYKGVASYRDQVLVSFELPDVVGGDGRPAVQSTRVSNLSGPKSTLTKIVKAATGGKPLSDGVDFESLLGKPVQLDLGKTSGGNSKIVTVSAVMSSIAKNAPKLHNAPRLLLDVENIGEKELAELPEWMRKVINERCRGSEGDDGDISF